MKILILNGPNLNLLGTREPDIYGSQSLEDIAKDTQKAISGDFKQVNCEWRQSNSELVLVDWVQNAEKDGFKAIVINPAAFTHTSVALCDALRLFSGKKVEVHLSNTYKREMFRKTKLTSGACDAVVEGFGAIGYQLAVRSILESEV